MLINDPGRRRRRKVHRRNPMPPALARYWRTHRRRRRGIRRGAVVRVRHVLNPRRSHRYRRNPDTPRTIRGFFSADFLASVGMGAAGIATPTLVTDRLLPGLGYTPTGWTRRAIQFAVPAGLLMLGGRRILGKGTDAFVTAAFAATGLGVLNDLTGGLATVSGVRGVGRYGLAPPVMGRYAPAPPVLSR